MGGVDLSQNSCKLVTAKKRSRPCGRGGFKHYDVDTQTMYFSPRPCGRGGFKLARAGKAALPTVPARVGGVDLSDLYNLDLILWQVPARVGGVDLSKPLGGKSAL